MDTSSLRKSPHKVSDLTPIQRLVVMTESFQQKITHQVSQLQVHAREQADGLASLRTEVATIQSDIRAMSVAGNSSSASQSVVSSVGFVTPTKKDVGTLLGKLPFKSLKEAKDFELELATNNEVMLSLKTFFFVFACSFYNFTSGFFLARKRVQASSREHFLR